MNKKFLLSHAALAMAAAMSGNNYFALERPVRRMSEDERRERAHRLNPVDMSQHEFIIKGERIMAHDRKVALKIYARRHGKKNKRL